MSADRRDLPPGYLVALDAALGGDPRLLDDWVRANTRAVPWGLLERAVSYMRDMSDYAARFLSTTHWDEYNECMQAAEQALATRADQPPADLADALVEGWVRLSGPAPHNVNLHVWVPRSDNTYGRWFCAIGNPPHDAPSWEPHSAPNDWPPAAWPGIPDQRTALLAAWAEVKAWRDGTGPAPWDKEG